MKKRTLDSLPVLPCACANLRRAARAVTRIYDEELRATQLELTQFTLLMTLDLTGETTQKALARLLAMDSTTLTRTLSTLVERRWIKVAAGDDRRQKLLSLSAAGRRKYTQARPHWERAQGNLRAKVGDEIWKEMGTLLGRIAATATDG